MPRGSKSGSMATAVSVILVLLFFVGLVAGAVDLATWAFSLVKRGIISAGRIAVLLGAIMFILASFCLIWDLIFAPLLAKAKEKREITDSIKVCKYPTRHGIIGISKSKVDNFLGTPLRQYILELGYTDPSVIDSSELSYLKMKELPRMLLGPFRNAIETTLQTPLCSAYSMGDEKVTGWLSPIIEAQRSRVRFRVTLRFLNILSFGRFGISRGEGFVRHKAEQKIGDLTYISNLLFKQFSSLPKWEHYVDYEFEEDVVLESEHELSESESWEETPPEQSIKGYLPAHAEVVDAEFVCGEESHQDDDVPNDDIKENLRNESKLAVETVLSFFDEKMRLDQAWDDPQETLKTIEDVLIQAQEHYEEPAFIREKILWIDSLKSKWKGFDAVFEDATNDPRYLDDLSSAPNWIQHGMSGIGEIVDMQTFKRACLVSYLMDNDVNASSESPKPTQLAVNRPIGM